MLMNDKTMNDGKVSTVSFDEFALPTNQEWHNEVLTALKGASFEKRMYTDTYEGIKLSPIYTLEDTEDILRDNDLPGMPPYRRGSSASGYISQPWAISQSCENVLPEEANLSMIREIKKGSETVYFELDACTRAGTDPKEKFFKGDYRGVSVSTLEDAYKLLKGLDLSAKPIHIYAGASVIPILSLFAAEARASGRAGSIKKYKGCIGADPLGELAAEGKLPIPLEELYDEMALAIQWAEEEMPDIKTILVRGDPYHNGGSNSTQEAAYAVSAAISYIRAMMYRGIEPDTTIKHIRFSLSIGANFFMEIARLRAIKMVWSQVVDSFGVDSEKSGKMDIIARTSRFTATVNDPYVNILRSTTQAFSGAVGGVSSLQVGCFDEAVRPGGEIAKRIARNIQIMLQTEFDLLQPTDPAGGAWYIETLTLQVAEEIWSLMQNTDSNGGFLKSLEDGHIQENVEKIFNSRLKNLAFRSDRALGTNMYPNNNEQALEYESPYGEELFRKRKDAVDSYKEIMDNEHTHNTLNMIMPSIEGRKGALVEAVINSFMAGASIGEVRDVLNDGFDGEVKVKPIGAHRWTEKFEALRKRTENYIARTGDNIRVFLVNIGPIPQHKARADFSTGFMEVAHFQVLKNTGFETTDEAVDAAVRSGADVAVICSTDDTYPELVPPIAQGIKAKNPAMKLYLAGAPVPEFKESYLKAGIDDFIHVRANCYEILQSIQNSKEGF